MRHLQPIKMRTLFASAAAACVTFAAPLANAETDYPNRPVTIVVGYAAGGATDIAARLLASALANELQQTVIVENKAGANSNIGAENVSRAKNDGYTLFVGTIANTINRALYKDLRYDFLNDFERIGMIATIANVLVVNPKSSIQSVDEYIDYAKAHPGKLSCASSGIGSSIHMSCELFKIRTGVNLLHVPYRGSGPAVADLLGGQVDSMFDNVPSSMAHIHAGKLRPIATTTEHRLASLPDVPTFKEAGVTDFLVQSWFGLDAPKGTPPAVIQRLNAALNRALDAPALKTAFEKNGFQLPAQPNTPQSHQAYVKSQVEQWASVISAAGLTAN